MTLDELKQLYEEAQGNLSARIKLSLLSGFEGLLSEGRIQEEIIKYLYFYIEREKGLKSVPYNMIIQCEDEDLSRDFILHLSDSLQQLTGREIRYDIITEKDLLLKGESLSGSFEKNDLIFINQCSADDKEYDEKVLKLLEGTPQTTKIIFASGEVIGKRFKKNEHLFYRVFSTHMRLIPYKAEDICEAFLLRMYVEQLNNNIRVESDFISEITKYIEVVYPKASLKGKAFIEDLYNRVMRETMASGDGRVINGRCVPYYHKPEEAETVENEIRQSLVLMGDKDKEAFINHVRVQTKLSKRGLSKPNAFNLCIQSDSEDEKRLAAKLYGKLLFSQGISRFLLVEELSVKAFNSESILERVRDIIRQKKSGVIYIKDAEKLSDEEQRDDILEALLREIHDNGSALFWIVDSCNGVGALDSPILSLWNEVFPYSVCLDKYSREEYKRFLLKYAKASDVTIDESALADLDRYYDMEEKTGRFSSKDRLQDIINNAVRNHIIRVDGAFEEEIVLCPLDFDLPKEQAEANTKDDQKNSPENEEQVDNDKKIEAEESVEAGENKKSEEKPEPEVKPQSEVLCLSELRDNVEFSFPTDAKIKNVLLLSLSIIPKEMKKSEFGYSFSEAKGYVSGYYQLEPVPKMLKTILEKQKETLDKIIILTTKETLDDDGTSDVLVKGMGNFGKHTPLEVFKNAVTPYMNPSIPDEDKYIIIPIEKKADGNDDLENAIYTTVNEIRKLDKPTLYLDTHGGFRDFALVSQAVISLIDNNAVTLKKIYGIHYDNNKGQIMDVSDEFHMFDFVSGMNEFLHTGRFDAMEQFFLANKITDADGMELIKLIKNMVAGVQMCNVEQFRKGYKDLRKYFENPRRVQSKNTYLSIFKNRIREDYAGLLMEKPTVLDEISWCRKKGFYQQALTLIESCMPLYFEETGYLIVNKDEMEIIEKKRLSNSDKEKIKKKAIVPLFNYAYPNHYKDKQDKFSMLKKNRLAEYIIDKRNANKMAGDLSYLIKDDIREATQIYDDKVEKVRFKMRFDFYKVGDKCKIMVELMKLHSALKEVRNSSNHAQENNEGITPEIVNWGIQAYLYYCQELGMYQGPEDFKLR